MSRKKSKKSPRKMRIMFHPDFVADSPLAAEVVRRFGAKQRAKKEPS